MSTGEKQEARMIAELRKKMVVNEPDRFVMLLRAIPVYQAYAKESFPVT